MCIIRKTTIIAIHILVLVTKPPERRKEKQPETSEGKYEKGERKNKEQKIYEGGNCHLNKASTQRIFKN